MSKLFDIFGDDNDEANTEDNGNLRLRKEELDINKKRVQMNRTLKNRH